MSEIDPTNDWRRAGRTSETVDVPSTSVVIVHYEQHCDLARLLGVLGHVSHELGTMDIVVADDGSPRPPSVGRRYGTAEARLVTQPDRGFRAAEARNRGAEHAKGDVLVFLDADVVPRRSAIRAMVRRVALEPWTLVVGNRSHVSIDAMSDDDMVVLHERDRVDPELHLATPRWLHELYRRTRDLVDAGERAYEGVISAHLATSRALFDHLGGFDGTMVGYGGEDYEFARRAWAAGAFLAHEPAARFWHNGPAWEHRLDSADKNAERIALHARLPPSAGSRSILRAAHARHVIVFDGRAWTDDALVHHVAMVIGALGDDVTVVLRGASDQVIAAVAGDARVHPERHGDPQPLQRALDRSSTITRIHQPFTIADGDAFHGALERVASSRPGRLVIEGHGAPVFTMWSTRARNQVIRHGRSRRTSRLPRVTHEYGDPGSVGIVDRPPQVDLTAALGR